MIDFSHYEGATAEAGDPDDVVHPYPPKNSRIKADLFVHYIENTNLQQDAVRFWFPEKHLAASCPVDYEILQQDLDDETAMLLIMNVYFYKMMDDAYAKQISVFSFKNLQTEQSYNVPYH